MQGIFVEYGITVDDDATACATAVSEARQRRNNGGEKERRYKTDQS